MAAKYDEYDRNYGEAAHEEFTRALGKPWSKRQWNELPEKERNAWIASAMCVRAIQVQELLA